MARTRSFASPFGVMDITIAPDVASVELEMLQLARHLESTRAPLRIARKILIDDMESRFDSETDPDGYKWEPLDELYLESKVLQGYPPDILTRTGELRRAATSEGNWFIAEDDDAGSIYFLTAGLPDYGLLHETGSGDADNIGISTDYKKHVRHAMKEGLMSRKAGKESLVGGMGVGAGNALPQRRFLGASEFVEEEIEAVFSQWVDAGVENVKVSSHGFLQKSIGGRFGPRI